MTIRCEGKGDLDLSTLDVTSDPVFDRLAMIGIVEGDYFHARRFSRLMTAGHSAEAAYRAIFETEKDDPAFRAEYNATKAGLDFLAR
jgi:hypothetical protein